MRSELRGPNTTNTDTIRIQLRPSNNFDAGRPKLFGGGGGVGPPILKRMQHYLGSRARV